MTPPVTDHATLRYAERVLNFDVAALKRRLEREQGGAVISTHKLLAAVGQALDIDPERLRAAVVPADMWDQVRASARFGCQTIKLESHILKLVDGRVTTVFRKNRRAKLRITSKRERAKSCQQHDRRRR